MIDDTKKRIAAAGLACCLFLAGLGLAAPSWAQRKEYLSRYEAEKIRDADTPKDRINLFISFAADRIQKLQYQLEHPGNNIRPEERANNLILNYTNCVDEAADLIDLGLEKQQDIRAPIKAMQMQGADFLAYLKGLEAQGQKMAAYKENLDDAIEATRSAINSANDAAKTIAPPVRRKVE
jgi:hypothetical protein